MAEHNRKRSQGKQPITKHPLFPATVALWFGTLFGLGGFAVRPSLLESLVLAVQLDTLVPAAAPPLGITFRVLLALALAAAGCMIGAFVGRTLSRPKQEAHERRRGLSAGFGEDNPALQADGARQEHGDGWPGTGSRRRGLAIADAPASIDYAERAPLPGGAPQILDLAEVDIEPFAEQSGLAPLPPVVSTEAGPAPLELSGFADEAEVGHGDFAALKQSFAEAMREGASVSLPARSLGRNFDRPGEDDARPAPPPELLVDDPDDDGIERFTAFPGEASDHELLAASPEPGLSRSSAFAAPIAARRPDDSQDQAADGEEPRLAHPASASRFAEPVAQTAPDPEPHLGSDDLDALSYGALLDRLAQSLQRRRKAALSREDAAAVSQVLEGMSPSLDQGSKAGRDEELSAGTAMGAEGAAAALPRFDAPAEDQAELEPAPGPLALPAALRPISFAEIEEDEDDWHPGLMPARQIVMPAAPDTGDDAESEALAAACGSIEEGGLNASVTAPAGSAAQGSDAEGEEDVLDAGYGSLLGLTNRAPARQSFIRIEEADAADAPIEPVVIFPGQEARLQGASPPRRFDAPEHAPPVPSLPVEAAPGLRRFDMPGERLAPAKAPAAEALDPQDREETERALRAALSTLQRMSGTA